MKKIKSGGLIVLGKKTLSHVLDRCNNPNNQRYNNYGGRGIECRITENELKEIWFRDKAYEMEKPSIDRIDNDGDYTFENCRYIELDVNRIKDRNKRISQYDLEGNFIREWNSLTKASVSLKLSIGDIWRVLNNQRKTCGGFKWRYKNVKN